LIWNAPLAVAVAVPEPISAFLQAVIASFVVLPASWLSAHLDAAPVCETREGRVVRIDLRRPVGPGASRRW
jgi:hypothetical protein